MADPLSVLMPAPRDTLLLKALVREGAAGRQAWQAWTAGLSPRGRTAGARDVIAALSARSIFVPLLYWNLGRNGISLDAELVTYLRSAVLTEDLRWLKYQEIFRSALAVLNRAGIPFLVLKGAALGEGCYPSPVLRHTGDIDLLLRKDDAARAADLFAGLGWRRASVTSPVARHHRHLPPLTHESGLPLELHHRIAPAFYTVPYDQLRARSVRTTITGGAARVLSPADSLLHTCLHAMVSARGLRWIVDAWFIVWRHPDLDWAVFIETARASRATLPVHAALRYLAEEMAVPVPERVVADARRHAAASGFLARWAARPIPSGRPGEIWESPGPPWRRAARLVGRAFPSPVALALQFDIPVWQMPGEYIHRTIRVARYVVGKGRD
jgi:hypothetical protein